jgi:hypothetical protein
VEITAIAISPFLNVGGTTGLLNVVVAIVGAPLLPVAAAIAILRYRLYEIDRLISRTVAYALVTGLLAAVYIAAFLGLQAMLAPVTRNQAPMVAASTLLVFALFAPLRRRTSGFVDRRFNRARYDAQREADAFATRVRDEVDAEHVVAALAGVLERTVQPASTALWLRPVNAR